MHNGKNDCKEYSNSVDAGGLGSELVAELAEGLRFSSF